LPFSIAMLVYQRVANKGKGQPVPACLKNQAGKDGKISDSVGCFLGQLDPQHIVT
jgi:hypothetical protein